MTLEPVTLGVHRPRRRSRNLYTGLDPKAISISTIMTTGHTIIGIWLTIWTSDLGEWGQMYRCRSTGRSAHSILTWTGTGGPHPSAWQKMTSSCKTSGVARTTTSSTQRPLQESLPLDTKSLGRKGTKKAEWMINDNINTKSSFIFLNHPWLCYII